MATRRDVKQISAPGMLEDLGTQTELDGGSSPRAHAVKSSSTETSVSPIRSLSSAEPPSLASHGTTEILSKSFSTASVLETPSASSPTSLGISEMVVTDSESTLFDSLLPTLELLSTESPVPEISTVNPSPSGPNPSDITPEADSQQHSSHWELAVALVLSLIFVVVAPLYWIHRKRFGDMIKSRSVESTAKELPENKGNVDLCHQLEPNSSEYPNVKTKRLPGYHPSVEEIHSNSEASNDGDSDLDSQKEWNHVAVVEHQFWRQLEQMQIEMVNMRSQIVSMKLRSHHDGEVASDPPLYDQIMATQKGRDSF